MNTTTRNRRAGVEDRWTVKSTGKPSAAAGKGKRWRARYVDDSGQERAKGFDRKADAQQWLAQITADLLTGSYVDPATGATTFGSFYADWSARQLWQSNTRTNMDLVCGAVPFGNVPLTDLRVSHLESWVAEMSQTFAPSTVRSRFANVRTVIRAAVADRHMPRDFTGRIRLPRTPKSSAMVVPTVEQVGAVIRAAEPQFAALVALCAFGGCRLGEVSALQVGDIDWPRRQIHVRRQVQWTDDG